MHLKKLMEEVEKEEIIIVEMELSERIKGIYEDNVIALNKNLKSNVEVACTLAEELGHHYTSVGDILDQSTVDMNT